MRNFILTGALAIATLSSQAQDFKTVLDKTFTAFDTTWDQSKKIDAANKLSLIAKKWDNEWSAHYYAAYAKAALTYLEKDPNKKDAYLDEADKEKDDAVSILKKDNDETYVLAAMIANARLAVDPMQRWQKYGKLFKEDLESAKEINPDNPRMYYLEGMSKFFTPKNFGGGKKAAMPYFEKAEALFNKEVVVDITKPHWGKEHNTWFLNQCKQQDKE